MIMMLLLPLPLKRVVACRKESEREKSIVVLIFWRASFAFARQPILAHRPTDRLDGHPGLLEPLSWSSGSPTHPHTFLLASSSVSCCL